MIVSLQSLKPGKTYQLQFSGVRPDGSVTEWTNSYSLTVDQDTAPAAPVGPSVTYPNGAGSFRVQWLDPAGGPSPDFSGYVVEVGDSASFVADGQFFVGRATSFDFTLAMSDAMYATPPATVYFQIRSIDLSGNISSPLSVSGTYPSVSAPGTPTATAFPAGLTWNWTKPATGADIVSYYQIDAQVYNVSPMTWSSSEVDQILGTTYTFAGSANTAYEAIVRAVDVFGRSVDSSESGSYTTLAISAGDDTTPPNNATSFAVASKSTTSDGEAVINLSWTASTTQAKPSGDLAGYSIKYNVNGSSTISTVIIDPSATTHTLRALKPGTQYDITIAAFDSSANFSTYLAVSGLPADKTTDALPAPAAVTSVAASWATPDLTVTITDGARPSYFSGYEVDITANSTTRTFYATTIDKKVVITATDWKAIWGATAPSLAHTAIGVYAVDTWGKRSAVANPASATYSFSGLAAAALSAPVLTEGTVAVSWSPGNYAVRHDVVALASAGGASNPAASNVVASVPNGTASSASFAASVGVNYSHQYKIGIISYDVFGQSATSSYVTTGAPSATGAVTVTSGVDAMKATWAAVAGATKYAVYAGPATINPPTVLIKEDPAVEASWQTNGNTQTWYCDVYPVNAIGTRGTKATGNSTGATIVGSDTTPPNGVLASNITATATPTPNGTYQVALDWNTYAPSETLKETIVRWGDASGVYIDSLTVESTVEAATITGLPRGTGNLYVKVIPVDLAGNHATGSTEKTVAKIANTVAPPVGPIGITWNTPTLLLTWSKPSQTYWTDSDTAGYRVTIIGTATKTYDVTETSFQWTPERNLSSGVTTSAYTTQLIGDALEANAKIKVQTIARDGTTSSAIWNASTANNTYSGTGTATTLTAGIRAMTATWTTVADAASYRLYADSGADAGAARTNTAAIPGDLKWTGDGLAATWITTGTSVWAAGVVPVNILGTPGSLTVFGSMGTATAVYDPALDTSAPAAPTWTAQTVTPGPTGYTDTTYIDISGWVQPGDTDFAGFLVKWGEGASPTYYNSEDVGTNTSHRITNLKRSQQYTIRIYSYDKSHNSTNYIQATSQPFTNGYAVPQNLTTTNSYVNSASWYQNRDFYISWTDTTTRSAEYTFDGYRVQFYNGTTWVSFDTKQSSFILTAEANKAAFNTEYAYAGFTGSTTNSLSYVRVYAKDKFGTLSGNYIWLSATTTPTRATLAGGNPSGQALAGSIAVNWAVPSQTNVVGYEVASGAGISAPNASTFPATNRVYFGSATAIDIPTGSSPASWNTYVRPIDVFGPDTSVSRWSNVYTVTAVPPVTVFSSNTNPPASVALSAGAVTADGKASITVTITNPASVSSVRGYRIRYTKSLQGTSPAYSGTQWSYANVDLQGAGGGSTVAKLEDLSPAVTYAVQAASIDYYGNISSYADTTADTVLTASDTGAPGAVAGFTPTPFVNGINFSWTRATESDVLNGGSYKIEIATNTGFSTGLITYYASGASSFFSATGLSSGAQYYSRITVTDASGNSTGPTNYGSPTFVTVGSPAAANLSDGSVPSSSPAVTGTGIIGGIYLNWPAISNPDYVTYEVYVNTATISATPAANLKAFETDGTSGIISVLPSTHALGAISLAPATPYYVRVRARDRDGQAAAAGTEWSGQFQKVASTQVGFTADTIGGPVVYSQGVEPSALTGKPNGAGIWYDTSAANKMHIWSGLAWVAQTFGSNAITANSITGNNIAGTTIVAANMATDSIAAGSIQANAVTSGKIQAGSVTADKLRIGSIGYAPVNSSFEYIDGSNNAVGWTKDSTAPGAAATITTTSAVANVASGTYALSLSTTATISNTARAVSDYFPLATATATPIAMGALVKTVAGAPTVTLQLLTYTTVDGTGAATPRNVYGPTATTGSFARVSGQLLVTDANVKSARWAINVTATTAAVTTVAVDGIDAGVAADATFIADGAISTSKIATGAITAGMITTGTMSGDRIDVNTLNGDRITTNSLDAGTLKAGSSVIQTLRIGSGGSITVGTGGTTAASGTIASPNYSSGTAGWSLGSAGLEINQGTIKAAALEIGGSNVNLMLPHYSDFEYDSTLYSTAGSGCYIHTSGLINTRATTTSQKQFGSSSLQIQSTGAGSVYLGQTATDYNFAVKPSTSYIVSFYAKRSTAGTQNVTVSLVSASTVTSSNININTSTMTRYSAVLTTGASDNQAILAINVLLTTGSESLFFDGVMVEEKLYANSAPGAYTLRGLTVIDGGKILAQTVDANTIKATTTMTSQLTVGAPGFIQSSGFTPGATTGFKVDSATGRAEFGDIVARGEIQASSGKVGGWGILKNDILSTSDAIRAVYFPGLSSESWTTKSTATAAATDSFDIRIRVLLRDLVVPTVNTDFHIIANRGGTSISQNVWAVGFAGNPTANENVYMAVGSGTAGTLKRSSALPARFMQNEFIWLRYVVNYSASVYNDAADGVSVAATTVGFYVASGDSLYEPSGIYNASSAPSGWEPLGSAGAAELPWTSAANARIGAPLFGSVGASFVGAVSDLIESKNLSVQTSFRAADIARATNDTSTWAATSGSTQVGISASAVASSIYNGEFTANSTGWYKTPASAFTPVRTSSASFTERSSLQISNGTNGSVVSTQIPAYSVSNRASSGTTRTLTVTEPPVLAAGEAITVSGVNANYDGTFTVLSTTATTVSYTSTSYTETIVAASGMIESSGAYAIKIGAGRPYEFSFYRNGGEVIYTILYRDANGLPISGANVSATTTGNSGWTLFTLPVITPSSAAYAVVQIDSNGVTAKYIDAIRFDSGVRKVYGYSYSAIDSIRLESYGAVNIVNDYGRIEISNRQSSQDSSLNVYDENGKLNTVLAPSIRLFSLKSSSRSATELPAEIGVDKSDAGAAMRLNSGSLYASGVTLDKRRAAEIRLSPNTNPLASSTNAASSTDPVTSATISADTVVLNSNSVSATGDIEVSGTGKFGRVMTGGDDFGKMESIGNFTNYASFADQVKDIASLTGNNFAIYDGSLYSYGLVSGNSIPEANLLTSKDVSGWTYTTWDPTGLGNFGTLTSPRGTDIIVKPFSLGGDRSQYTKQWVGFMYYSSTTVTSGSIIAKFHSLNASLAVLGTITDVFEMTISSDHTAGTWRYYIYEVSIPLASSAVYGRISIATTGSGTHGVAKPFSKRSDYNVSAATASIDFDTAPSLVTASSGVFSPNDIGRPITLGAGTLNGTITGYLATNQVYVSPPAGADITAATLTLHDLNRDTPMLSQWSFGGHIEGPPGPATNWTATAETIPNGSAPTVSVSGASPDNNMHIQIPEGPSSFAQVGTATPSARGTGDMWFDLSKPPTVPSLYVSNIATNGGFSEGISLFNGLGTKTFNINPDGEVSHGGPAFEARKLGAWNSSSSLQAVRDYDSVYGFPNGSFNAVTGVFTPPANGVYLFTCFVGLYNAAGLPLDSTLKLYVGRDGSESGGIWTPGQYIAEALEEQTTTGGDRIECHLTTIVSANTAEQFRMIVTYEGGSQPYENATFHRRPRFGVTMLNRF